MGHERTSRHVRFVSVIPLKADIHQRGLHVRLVPQADVSLPAFELPRSKPKRCWPHFKNKPINRSETVTLQDVDVHQVERHAGRLNFDRGLSEIKEPGTS
jgi:hypothetical protein